MDIQGLDNCIVGASKPRPTIMQCMFWLIDAGNAPEWD